MAGQGKRRLTLGSALAARLLAGSVGQSFAQSGVVGGIAVARWEGLIPRLALALSGPMSSIASVTRAARRRAKGGRRTGLLEDGSQQSGCDPGDCARTDRAWCPGGLIRSLRQQSRFGRGARRRSPRKSSRRCATASRINSSCSAWTTACGRAWACHFMLSCGRELRQRSARQNDEFSDPGRRRTRRSTARQLATRDCRP